MNGRTLAALIAIGVIAVTSLYLQPLLVGGMITDRGFTEQQAGLIASADLAGLALASCFAIAWLSRLSWRTMAWIGLAVVLGANVATTRIGAFEAFTATRFLCGLGSGTLLAIAIVGIGHSAQADRHYGFLLVCQLLFGTLGLWAAPFLQAQFRLDGLYLLMAGLAGVVAATSASAIPAVRERAAAIAIQLSVREWMLCSAVLLAVLVFFVEQNAVWAYAERMGNAAGLTGEYIGFSLGLANLVGLGGAALVAGLGVRAGRWVPLLLATAVQVACLYALMGETSDRSYLVAMCLLAFGWNVVIPYQQGLLAEVDHSGKALALVATATGVGLALGPGAAASVLSGEGYMEVNVLAGVLAVLSMVLVVPALLHVGRGRTKS